MPIEMDVRSAAGFDVWYFPTYELNLNASGTR